MHYTRIKVNLTSSKTLLYGLPDSEAYNNTSQLYKQCTLKTIKKSKGHLDSQNLDFSQWLRYLRANYNKFLTVAVSLPRLFSSKNSLTFYQLQSLSLSWDFSRCSIFYLTTYSPEIYKTLKYTWQCQFKFNNRFKIQDKEREDGDKTHATVPQENKLIKYY